MRRRRTVFCVIVVLLGGAAGAAAAAPPLVPGTSSPDVLAGTGYDWSWREVVDGLDFEGTPDEAGLAYLAMRMDATLGALEAVHAVARGDGDLAPVFQVAMVPVLIAFDPPLPIGDGLEAIEPQRLVWSVPEPDERGTGLGALEGTSRAEVPLPVDEVSPPEDPAVQTGESGVRLVWRAGVVPAAHDDVLAGTRSPAAVRATWDLILPEGAWGAHNVTWMVQFDSRVQSLGARHAAAGADRFDGLYLEREVHRAGYRMLTLTGPPESAADPERDAARAWLVVDLAHGTRAGGSPALLPTTLVAMTTAALHAREGMPVGDRITMELAFYRLTDAAVPPDAAPPDGPGEYPPVPSWWHVALVLLALLWVVAPRGGRGSATNA